MPADSPRYIEPSYLYQGEDGHVFLDGTDYLDPKTKKLTKLRGKVAIMLTMLQTGETGYVADMRFITDGDDIFDAPSDEPPEDNEEFTFWEKDKAGMRPVYAIMARDPDTGKEEPTGDPDFYNAAIYLAGEVDVARKALKRKAKDATKKAVAKPTKPATVVIDQPSA